MKLTEQQIKDFIIPSIKARCVRPDKCPVQSIYNVFHYINKLNDEISVRQDFYEGMSLDNIMLPSGLAQFIEPRRIMFDIQNECNYNFRKWDRTDCLIANNYTYNDFVLDLNYIYKAMRINEWQFNVSVKQAIQDVNVMSIVDKIAFMGCVKWDGNPSTAFVPYFVTCLDLGLSEYDYQYPVNLVINALFTHNVVNVLSK